MKIIQIAIDSHEIPYTVKYEGNDWKSNVLGLGEDSQVYIWISSLNKWIPFTEKIKDETGKIELNF